MTPAVVETLKKRELERDLQQLRPLGEAFTARRFAGQLNHADAEDVVAQVLATLHLKAESGERFDNLRAVFFRSCQNKAIDVLRARRDTVSLEVLEEAPADDPSTIDLIAGGYERAQIREALELMNPRYREAILLRFAVGLSLPELATHMRMTLTAAKKVVMRATRQIREHVLAIEAGERCDEMQTALFDRRVCGAADDDELAALDKHLAHCSTCTSFLARLRGGMHEAAGGLLVSTATTDQLTGSAALADHLTHLAGAVGEKANAFTDKVRVAAFKANGALGGGSDAAAGGALAGTGQKIAAVCATGATAATCVAAGAVPGIGVGEGDAPAPDPMPIVEVEQGAEEAAPPSDTTLPEVPSPASATAAGTQDTAPAAPVRHQATDEVGFEEAPEVSAASSGGGGEFGAPAAGGGGGSGASGGGGEFGGP